MVLARHLRASQVNDGDVVPHLPQLIDGGAGVAPDGGSGLPLHPLLPRFRDGLLPPGV